MYKLHTTLYYIYIIPHTAPRRQASTRQRCAAALYDISKMKTKK